MKVKEIRLLQEPTSSFILYHERNPFTRWHYHPEYELVLIRKGRGRRMVGDHIDRFKENDLVLIGPNLPHEWLCDQKYFKADGGFLGDGIVIQFLYNFLGKKFFDLPENFILKNVLSNSLRGIEISNESKSRIKHYMLQMLEQGSSDRLYSLLMIFQALADSENQHFLSSPTSLEPVMLQGHEPMRKALDFILQNYQNHIEIKDLLEITNMSNTAFYASFKSTYGMSFKSYLLKIRVGYACRLLTDGFMTISEIAYDCGFENISNFNRQFKKIKRITPTEFQDRVNNGKNIPVRNNC